MIYRILFLLISTCYKQCSPQPPHELLYGDPIALQMETSNRYKWGRMDGQGRGAAGCLPAFGWGAGPAILNTEKRKIDRIELEQTMLIACNNRD